MIQVAGLSQRDKELKPEDIGFRLGPRINAVGRIADPQIVIELLTTDDWGVALERAMQCEQINQHRQQLCEQIEQEAIAWCERSQIDLQQERVLVIVQPEWHHGVIGIVASRLVERYGVPVFIGTYEDELQQHIRGSARSIPEFHVFEALQFCCDLLEKFGGHRAAGGFSLAAENLEVLRSRLSAFAHQQLQPEHLKPLVSVDVQANLDQLDLDLYRQVDALHPCGIDNPEPVFWMPDVRVLEQKRIGKGLRHLKLTICQGRSQRASIKAIAWNWGQYYPLLEWTDVAYRLRENQWNGETNLELELVGIQPARTTAVKLRSQSMQLRAIVAPTLPSVPGGSTNLSWSCSEPPPRSGIPQWFALESLDRLLPQVQGSMLLYGAQRPQLPETCNLDLIDYDRPRRAYTVMLLWTLPPSQFHLHWLVTLAKPKKIFVRNAVPDLPTPAKLESQLQRHLPRLSSAIS